ncbi:MAG TPA: M1 family metallopeptidase, partial [Arachidicoccus sp.]
MKKVFILLFGFIICSSQSYSQLLSGKEKVFTHADTLRGSIGGERAWWNVLRYDITVKPDYERQTISGKNIITYFDNGGKTMQIDLQEPLEIDSVSSDSQKNSYRREGNAYHIFIRDSAAKYKIKPGVRTIAVYYHGKPGVAKHAPWDGGWIWTKDSLGRPWMTLACQGLGASVWYPCKDYQGDEPDSGASLTTIVADTLVAVANGHLMATKRLPNHLMSYTWAVKSPINNYDIVPYIGKYTFFDTTYNGLKGELPVSLWALDYDMDKMKAHCEPDVLKMLKAFEYWYGAYPFYEDGYKLVEAPHLGMEHQSDIAYGNHFLQGYLGRDLSHTDIGLKFDFIIVHESGHEWFGNSITSKDIADMWIHESFTNYCEALFTEYYWGKKQAQDYVFGIRQNIENDKPIIGVYGVNDEGSGDMYYKGANMINNIRNSMDNDSLFRGLLHGLNTAFYHQTVTSKQIEDY